ncbi:MAG: PAS domain S-box protein [Ignavibacteria bacterium]|nr:PAS domain S-box protein [Ignavibacteria bacterium]
MSIQKISPDELRPTGIDIIGGTNWGTHFCNFYETKQDMLDILVPFFKAGLEHNEYCVYITSDPVTVKDAENSLRNGIPEFDSYLSEKRIEILPHTDWYLKAGRFDSSEIFKSWDGKLRQAISNGFEGLRINGNATWLERNIWDTFIEYERDLNEHIMDKQIIVMCTYPLGKCIASDVLDVAHVHKAAIAKRKGTWEIFETPDTKQTKAQIIKKNDQLKDRINIGTQQLKEAGIDLEIKTLEHSITEDALQRSEANLRSVFENTGTSLILLDTNLNILLFNGNANNLAKNIFQRSFVYGLNMLELILEDRREEFVKNCKSVLEGNQVIFEASYPMPDNSICWYNTRIFPIQIDDNRNIGICISAEDITERKNEEFEKEKMTNDLIHRNKDLEQFSYMVSHNLRAPVANIMGFSKMLINNKSSDEDKIIFGEQINSSAQILDEVIRDLNMILTVKTELISRREKVLFSALVDNIRKIIQQVIEKENAVITTDFEKAGSIIGNRVYLYSIFLNLISNSIKYHQPGLAPLINISTIDNQGKIFIVFEDNGLGIDMLKNKNKVFGLYKRFHPEIKGKGMGLYMVKSQVELLGGSISIKSKVNKGTTFTIELNK